MFKRHHHVYQEEAGGGTAAAPAPGANPPAASPAAPAPAAAAPAGAPAAPAAAPAAPTNLLTDLGTAPPAAPAPGAAPDLTTSIPEQYHVKAADGMLDVAATSAKLGEAYKHLQARMVEHGAPPKTADEYKVTVPEQYAGQWDPDADESVAAFRQTALGLGLSQKQFEGVVNSYLERIPGMVQQTAEQRKESCKTALGEVWRTPKEMQDNSRHAFRAVTSLLGADADRAMEASGNDPWFLRLAAAVGGEMAEDKSPGQGDGMGQFNGMSRDQLMAHPAYTDSRHVDHERVGALVRRSFEKQYGTAPAM